MKITIKDVRLRLIISLFIITSFVLAVKLFLPKPAIPQVVETFPKNNQEEVETDIKIVITFADPPIENDWEIKTFPNFSFDKIVNENTLEIIPTASLNEETRYTIELFNKVDSQFYFAFSFITEKETVDTGLGDPNFIENLRKQTANYYPLIKYDPPETVTWTFKYLEPKKLQVTLVQDTPSTRQEVLNWIRSKGVAPETHEIIWKVK